MSVLLETSAGDIVIDLLVDYAPKMCENFLKLCKMKYYNFSPIHSIQKSFSFQTGDPLGPLSATSDGGTSIWGLLPGDASEKTFPALFHPKLKHLERGTVSMATAPHPSNPDARLAGSQFIVTLGDDGIDYLDGRAAIFGKVVEGFDTLEKINEAIVDERGHPLADVRIRHTAVLDDPYPDPAGLREPSTSPPPSRAQLATVRIGEGESVGGEDSDGEEAAEAERRRRARDAEAQALTLEMIGDLPFAGVAPPENVLFVCKLNPVTGDADLELIFSRFGRVLSCEVVRDRRTGDSLQYAFVEFEERAACEAAYAKMDGVLIDDRRIHVDFSQSVSRLSDAWRSETNQKRRKAASRNGGGGGGWGGVKELEKWRKYREGDEEKEGHQGYGMVYGAEEMRGRHKREEDNGKRDHEDAWRNDEREERNARRGYTSQQHRRDSRSDSKQGNDPSDSQRRRYSRSRSPRPYPRQDSRQNTGKNHDSRDWYPKDQKDRRQAGNSDRRHERYDRYWR